MASSVMEHRLIYYAITLSANPLYTVTKTSSFSRHITVFGFLMGSKGILFSYECPSHASERSSRICSSYTSKLGNCRYCISVVVICSPPRRRETLKGNSTRSYKPRVPRTYMIYSACPSSGIVVCHYRLCNNTLLYFSSVFVTSDYPW